MGAACVLRLGISGLRYKVVWQSGDSPGLFDVGLLCLSNAASWRFQDVGRARWSCCPTTWKAKKPKTTGYCIPKWPGIKRKQPTIVSYWLSRYLQTLLSSESRQSRVGEGVGTLPTIADAAVDVEPACCMWLFLSIAEPWVTRLLKQIYRGYMAVSSALFWCPCNQNPTIWGLYWGA